MPAPGGRRGRRDNGLSASHYESVGDVDPRVGEHLLDVLAADGIAAYLQPSTDLHPITRSTSLPARPTDRLFVDREHVRTARDHLGSVDGPRVGSGLSGSADAPEADAVDAVEPDAAAPDDSTDDGRPSHASTGTARPRRDPQPRVTGRRRTDPPTGNGPDTGRDPGEGRDPGRDEGAGPDAGSDVDNAWAAIVAGYHLTADQRPATISPADGVTLSEPRFLPRIDPYAEPFAGDPRRPDPGEPSLLDALDTFGTTLPADGDESDEGYEPPPAPPLPRISAAATFGVVGIIAGLLLFVWPDLMPLAHDVVLVLAFGLIVAGFGTLIWRLRPGDDEEDDDDFDDGARI